MALRIEYATFPAINGSAEIPVGKPSHISFRAPLRDGWRGDALLAGEPHACKIPFRQEQLDFVQVAHPSLHLGAKLAILFHLKAQKEE